MLPSAVGEVGPQSGIFDPSLLIVPGFGAKNRRESPDQFEEFAPGSLFPLSSANKHETSPCQL